MDLQSFTFFRQFEAQNNCSTLFLKQQFFAELLFKQVCDIRKLCRPCQRRFFDPPPTKIYRRAAADYMKSAHRALMH